MCPEKGLELGKGLGSQSYEEWLREMWVALSAVV